MSRMLKALRRIEGRRHDDEDHRQDGQRAAALIRPRRRTPGEPAAADEALSAPAAALRASPAREAPLHTPAQLPGPSGGIEPAAPLGVSEPGRQPLSVSDPLEGGQFSGNETDACSVDPGPQAPTSLPPSPAISQPGVKTATFEPGIRRLDAQFLDVAAQVLARVPSGQPAAVGLCALEPGGLWAVAPLAVAMVQQLPGDVVLVEADQGPTSLAERLGTYTGQSDRIPLEVLCTGKGWSQLARPTGVFRLSLVAGMRRLPGGPRPDGRWLWEAAVEELRQQHQLVLVVVGPPYDAAGQAALKCCDAVFVLATLRRTGTRRARRFLRSVRHAGVPLRGVILIDLA